MDLGETLESIRAQGQAFESHSLQTEVVDWWSDDGPAVELQCSGGGSDDGDGKVERPRGTTQVVTRRVSPMSEVRGIMIGSGSEPIIGSEIDGFKSHVAVSD
ncbi:hypothetical protein Tco_1478308 [Tanacetum coccineum]